MLKKKKTRQKEWNKYVPLRARPWLSAAQLKYHQDRHIASTGKHA
jgi:hypothetical protein